jgi:hypothetical protein
VSARRPNPYRGVRYEHCDVLCAALGVPRTDEGGVAMGKLVVVGIVIAFLVFYIMTSPDQAANIVHHTWSVAVNVAHGVGHFIDKLAS